MKITLVVGHKKESPGACNQTNNVCEWEFNDKLAHDIAVITDDRCKIEIVYRDRYRDLPKKINALNPNFVVCLHANASFNGTISGSETLFYYKSRRGKKMATIFQKKLVAALCLRDRGIKGKSSEQRGGFVLRETKVPCILLEPFFIDNDNDYRKVIDRYPELIRACNESIYEIIDTV